MKTKVDSKNYEVWRQYADRQGESNDLMDLYNDSFINPLVDLGKSLWKRIAGDAPDEADDNNQEQIGQADMDTTYDRAVEEMRPIDENDCKDFLDEAFLLLKESGLDCEHRGDAISFTIDKTPYYLRVLPCRWNSRELYEVEIVVYYAEKLTPRNLHCANETNKHSKSVTALGEDFIVFVSRGQMKDCDHLLDFVNCSLEEMDYSAKYFYSIQESPQNNEPTRKVGFDIHNQFGK